MVVNYGSKKPPKEDWRKSVCRSNYAKGIAASDLFGRDFNLVKIVWDKEGGYPEHSWGYTQYTVRPVWPGFGCDGTTDNEHHARVSMLLSRLGMDADTVYRRSMRKRGEKDFSWVPSDALKYVVPGKDFILPVGIPGQKEIQDMLYDLYQLNNRTYGDCIVEELEKRKIEVPDYNDPAVEFPREYPVPPSGLPVKVTISVDEGETGYYISDGYMSYCLFKQKKYPYSIDITPYWWVEFHEVFVRQLEKMTSDRARCRCLEERINEGKAPVNVMEHAREYFSLPERKLP